MTLRYALLAAILLVAGFLRFYRLTTVPPGLYRDEAMDGCDALQALETGSFQVFYPEDNGREGLYVNVAAVFVRFLGNQAWVLRLPAAIFGLFTVWGVYLLAAEWESVPVGLLAAFFTATSFWHMLFSRIALRAIAAPLFLVWGLYLVLVALRRRSAAMAVLAGAVYGLGFYTYPAYRVTPLLLAVVLFRSGRLAAWFAAAAAAVAAPLAAYFAGHPAMFWLRASQVSVFRSTHPAWEIVLNLWRTGRMFFTRGDLNWRHNYAWRAELFWPVAILFALGISASRGKSRLWLLWLVLAALPAVLSNEGVPHALRSLLMVPAVFILAAIGAWRLYRWLGPQARIPAAILAVLLCYEPYHTYFDRWATNPNVPAFFDERPVPGDAPSAWGAMFLAGRCSMP